VYTQYLWPISSISSMQCFYGPTRGVKTLGTQDISAPSD